MKDMRDASIEVTAIGQVVAGSGVEATKSGEPATWPSFPADEIVRLFAHELNVRGSGR
jgi:hypothetical protein